MWAQHGLGGEARCGPNMAKKWWETVARLAPERLQPGLGKSGSATVRRGASGSSPRPFRGAFGTPKSALGELSELRNGLSEAFERAFRWHVRFQSWSLALRSTRDGSEHRVSRNMIHSVDKCASRQHFFPGSAHVASGQEIRRPRRGVRVGLK